MSESVLDASALIALLFEEPGVDLERVERAIDDGASIGVLNLIETLSTAVRERGDDPLPLGRTLAASLTVFALDEGFVAEVARLASRVGGGLGDRACLAIGRLLDIPILTADAPMARRARTLGLKVELLRR